MSNSESTGVIWYSLMISADGNELAWVCQNPAGASVCLACPLVLQADQWVLLTCGYSETNSTIYLNDQLVATGDGIPSIPQELESLTSLVIGSQPDGTQSASGQFEEFSAFTGTSRFLRATRPPFGLDVGYDIVGYWTNKVPLIALGPVTDAEIAAQQQAAADRLAARQAASLDSPLLAGGFDGPLVSDSFACGTNSIYDVWFTNLVVTNITGQGWTVSFNIAGGTNGAAYGLYRSANAGAPFASTNWQWLQYVYACDSVQLTNQGPTQFYLLAGEKDSDGDGMPDSWEVLHGLNPNDPSDAWADPDHDGLNNLSEYQLGTDPQNPDTDYDGICDGQEVADGTNPLDPESVTPVLLGSWRFDDTNWFGLQNQAPISSANLALVGGVSLNAVAVDSTNAAWLTYADTNGMCYGNINLRKGSLRVWFKSAWNSSTTNNGSGPLCQGRLIEIGTKGATAWWALALDAKGTNLSFFTPTGSGTGFRTNLSAAILWTSNDWHQIVLTWSPNSSALYLDGQPANTNGSGVAFWPDAPVRAGGFRLGSDGGTNQAHGRFDNLQTYNYVLSADAVAAGYSPPCWSAMDVVLVTDCSGSMGQLMADGVSKLSAAKQAGSNFITHLNLPNNDQVGLVSFTNSTTLEKSLTNNGTAVITKLFSLSSGGNTRIDYGITNAQGELTSSRHRPDSLPVMVVLTDGSNDPPSTRTNVPIAALNATSAGTRLITVALGTNADTALLQQIASSTNYAYAATNSSQLNGVYDLIAGSLCRLSHLPPVVNITSPTNNQGFNYPASFNITATASDPQDGLVRVDFYGGTNFIGSDYYAPFAVTWNGAQLGTNVVTAIAYNEFGLSRTSSVAVVLSSQPPVVQITAPTNGQLFVISPTNISITATSSVPGGSITNLALYSGSNGLFQTNGSASQFLWTNVVAATNTLSAVATDNRGRSATNTVTVIINAMPVVTINTPTNFQSFMEVTNVPLSATAHDPDGDSTIAQVKFYSGTNLLGPGTHSGSNWTLTWSNRLAGTYPVTAIATDNRTAASASTTAVFVVNPTNAPSVAITFPLSNLVFSPGADITITAAATETNGAITNVEFFVGTNFIGSDPGAPYSVTKCCWSAGSYVLLARATDSNGVSTLSAPVPISVGDPKPTSGNGFWDPFFGTPGSGTYTAISAVKANGTDLYVAGGYLGSVGGEPVYSVAKWDGTNWSDMSGEDLRLSVYVHQFAFDGTNIYAVGERVSGEWRSVAQWDGADWVELGDLIEGEVNAITIMGSDVYIGGNFTSSENDTNVQYVAKLNKITSQWEPVGNDINGPVFALASVGNHLFAGGIFTNAGANANANGIAELNGNTWTNLGTGLGGTNSWGAPGGAFALAVCDTNLFVGGDFTVAGGNANANGVALWDGHTWKMIGQGLAGSDVDSYSVFAYETELNPEPPTMRIFSLVAQGNVLFAGGEFRQAWDRTNRFPVNHIAKAVWSEDNQAWSWTDLDQGLIGSGEDDFVLGLALMPGTAPNAYDLFAVGHFSLAGAAQVYSHNLARWSVGRPFPTNAPSVAIVAPAPNQTFTDPDSITFAAQASPGTSTVSYVEFYIDRNVDIGSGTAAGDFYTNVWTAPLSSVPAGPHSITAVLYNDSGIKFASKPVPFVLASTNNPIIANNDTFTLMANSPPASLPVLTNDLPGSGLSISDAGHSLAAGFGEQTMGTVSVSYDRKSIVYAPAQNAFGTDTLYYTVTNSSGATAQAFVTVTIAVPPTVQITQPADQSVVTAPTSLTIAGTALDWDGVVGTVQLYTNGFSCGSALIPTSSNTFSASWSQTTPGFYTFVAVATDDDGYTNVSAPVTIQVRSSSTNNHPPVASISSPVAVTTSLKGLAVASPFMVRDGRLTVTGSAYDLDAGDAVSYQILLLNPANASSPALYNLTPTPLNAQGFHTGAVTNGILGTNLDLSLVQNGTYLLTLVVRGGGDQASASVLIGVESGLKIGQFSFSEQDLTIPVNGIPLTVTRTYNSLNPRSADFGYSWSYALNAMDVQLDDQRTNVVVGTDQAPFADDEEDANGLPSVVSIRTGGGWDVTLTLPDGRRTTFAFTPDLRSLAAYAQWTPPPDVHASLGAWPPASEVIDYFPALHWRDSDNSFAQSTFENHDIPGWVLTNWDGTAYFITRGQVNNVTYDTTGNGSYISVPAYGPPQLSSIVQRSGDTISIGTNGIAHYAPNALTPTRSVWFDRDSQNRITAIYDPNAGSNGLPAVRYVYHADTGNLLQVLKLVDRSAGTYLTNKYHYDNPNFPHYITSIENPLGVPVARNEYDDSGRLTAVVDPDGNRTEFIHSTTNQIERVIDRLGHTNTFAYDLRGNVTAATNALGGITLSAYDDQNNKTNEIAFLAGQPYAINQWVYDTNGFLLVSYDPLGYSNTFTYNQYGQVTTNTDARGFSTVSVYDDQGNLRNTIDALNNTTTYSYNALGLLTTSQDPLGTITRNTYDDAGNLVATATFTSQTSGLPPTNTVTIFGTNTFGYDANGNRTNSVVWRRVNGNWVGATNTYILDALNRAVQTIAPDGGTNTTIYNEIGKQAQTIDPLGHTNSYVYDDQGGLVQTTYPDDFSEHSTYDANGNRTNSTDQLGRVTKYVYDALNRIIQTIYPDNTTNTTVYDDLGRVEFSVDARGFTNAFGYDAAGRRIAVTNALGVGGVQMTNGFNFDADGNQVTSTDGLGRTTTNVFDALNRTVELLYPDGTKTFTGYDAAGRRVAETNQDNLVTRFAYDGAGRLLAVTNALMNVTLYTYDEAGNETVQTDANQHTTTFAYDSMGRRTKRTLPQNQSETMGYDLAGNLIRSTNFNNVVLTNLYDVMNRLTNRASINGYTVSFAYSATGQRTNTVDLSGTTAYVYDDRDRLLFKTNSFVGGLDIVLNYAYDRSGNVTNIWSSSTSGVNLQYAYDPLNRITNVLANGSNAANYGFDFNGNMQTVHLGNGVTNLYQYDLLNRLTNSVWKSNQLTLASFYYQLGKTGNRTNLTETLLTAVTNRIYTWSYDSLYRLTNENISALGTLGYRLDPVGNRTNRDASGSISSTIPSVANAYSANDWLTNDTYDANGNALWDTNATAVGPYFYDVENRLTNFNNTVFLAYNGDGIRVRKSANGTNFSYLVDDRNPTGYPQVLEEWTASGGITNLARVYNYGMSLVSQRQASGAVYYFIPDGHGSTRLVTDGSGSAINALTYDAYGNLITSSHAAQTVYLFCGEQFDPDLDFYYLRARYLNPNTGRFWTMDSSEGNPEDPKSLQLYFYCEEDPVNNSDPEGHDIVGTLAMMDIGFFLAAQGPPVVTQFIKGIKHGTIWFKIGFDTSVTPDEDCKNKVKHQLAELNEVLRKSCPNWGMVWLGNVNQTFDSKRKKAPRSGSYESGTKVPFSTIQGHDGGIPLMVTILNIWSGHTIAFGTTSKGQGILFNVRLNDPRTVAHEIGHWAGWTGGNRDRGNHTSDPNNIMFVPKYRGEDYSKATQGDRQYCEKVTNLAK